jgi:hypothetical protein
MLCPVRRLVTTLDCALLKDNNRTIVACLGPDTDVRRTVSLTKGIQCVSYCEWGWKSGQRNRIAIDSVEEHKECCVHATKPERNHTAPSEFRSSGAPRLSVCASGCLPPLALWSIASTCLPSLLARSLASSFSSTTEWPHSDVLDIFWPFSAFLKGYKFNITCYFVLELLLVWPQEFVLCWRVYKKFY